MTWEHGEHAHPHGDHVHTHVHYRDPLEHDGASDAHGWHDAPEGGAGRTDHDDTFGEEPLSERRATRLDWEVTLPWGVFMGTPAIIVPYVPGKLVAPLDDFRIGSITTVDVSGSQYDYWSLLAWVAQRAPDGFILCEQDMAPTRDDLERLWACEEDWCGCDYPVFGGLIVERYGDLAALGLTKVRGWPQAVLARALRAMGPVTWSRLDGAVYTALRSAGLFIHAHPAVAHLHDYGDSRPSFDPTAPPL